MIRKIYYLSALLSCAIVSAQSYEWGGKFGGNGEDVVLAMHVDAAGNTYTTGFFTMTCDFDPTDNAHNLTTGIQYDCFIQKIAPDGTLLWVKSIGGPEGDNGTKITSDADGNVYVTGVFQETADFDPSPNEFLLTSAGNLDIFILKLTANGDFVWAKNFAGVEYEEANGMGTDSEGNLYVSGYFYDPVDFDPGDEEFTMSTVGSGDGFVVKLTPEGEFEWAKRFGGPDFDLATGMRVMPNGDLYISGNFSLTADFDPDEESTFELTADPDYSGVYLLHLKSTGDFTKAVRVAHVGGPSYGLSVDVDNTGAAYITGYLGANAVFPTVGGDFTMTVDEDYFAYVAKVNASGTVAWAKQLKSTQITFANALAVNSLNEVIVSGYYNGALILGSTPLTEDNASPTMNYITKLDSNGNFMWAQHMGGIDFIDRCAIAVDGNNNTYFASAFDGTVDINPNPDQTDEATVVDFRDSFVVKINNQALSTPDNINNPVFAVYPNPTNGILNISGIDSLSGVAYKLYDITGRQIMSGTLESDQMIDIAALQTGHYNILIGNSPYRIIKE